MSSRGSIADRWSWGQLNQRAKLEEVIRELNLRNGALERTLARIQERLEFGPIPGAYFPVFMTYPGAVSALTGAAVVSLKTTFASSMRPVWITAALGGGTSVNVTVAYWNGGYVALHGTALVATPTGAYADARQDFDIDTVVNDAVVEQRLRLSTIAPVGSPRDLTVMVMFKSRSKVEPA